MSTALKLTRTEPFKTLFTIYALGRVLFKLPFRILFYIRRANRPRSSWTLAKAVLTSSIGDISDLGFRTGRFGGRDFTKEVAAKDCQGACFIWLEPVPHNLIAGQLEQFAEAAGVKSVRIPAYGFGQWNSELNGTRLAGDDEKIVIHVHGGGYVLGSAHPEDTSAGISSELIKWGKGVVTRTLSVDYRLASSAPYPKSTPFPSALIDTLAGYVYLSHKLGFKSQNIIVAGDSAGGNLALAFVRYLRDNPELGLGMPGGLLLFSPWCDPVQTHVGATAQKGKSNVGVDYVKPATNTPHSMGVYILNSLLGDISREVAAKNLYISPASLELEPTVVSGMFSGFPPSYVLGGEGEVLIDEIRTLQQRMAADLPEGKLVYDEVMDAIHDFVIFQFWEPERTSTFQRVVKWIHEL